MAGATPDSLLAFHDAGYREMAERIGPGTVLDVGCGVGDQTARLTGLGRLVIGVDYDAQTALDAAHEWEPRGMRFAAMDGARIAAKAGSIDWVCSSHIIEHFRAPEQHAAELARASRLPTAPRSSSRRTDRPTSRTRSTCRSSKPTSSSRCSHCSSTT